MLLVSDGRIALQQTGRGAPGPVFVSFDDAALSHRRRGGHNELLGKAIGWRREQPPAVVDTTAGFGRDAFVLADLGCRVRLCERQPVMAILLQQAISEAVASENAWLRAVAARMYLLELDARELPPAQMNDVDVIYLDPMFAQARKAAPGKAMQALQLLAGDDAADAADLLSWARRQPVRRVVVKRARRAPDLGLDKPAHRLSGRAVRFDVYTGASAE